MATLYTGKDYKYGYYEHVDFDSIVPGSVAWRQLRIKNMTIHPTINPLQREVSVGNRQEEDDDYSVIIKGVEQTVTFEPYDAERERLAQYLMLAMQSCTEAAASPYSKVFLPHSTQPDFAADAGRMIHLSAAHPAGGSSSFLACGAILRELTISVSPDNIGRRLLAGGTFLCRRIIQNFAVQGSYFGATNSAAPWTFDDIYCGSANGGVSLGGTAVTLYGFDMTYTNGARYTNTASTDCYAEQYVFDGPKVTGTLRIRRTPTIEAVLANWTAGTLMTYIMTWSTTATVGATSGDLRILIPMAFDKVECDRTNEELFVITYTGKKTDTYNCLEVLMSDGIDHSW